MKYNFIEAILSTYKIMRLNGILQFQFNMKKGNHSRSSSAASDRSTKTNETSSPTRKIFIGGLSDSIEEDVLRDMFAPFGNIIFFILKKPETKNPFAFIEFQRVEMAEKAVMKMNGKKVEGKMISVKFRQEQRQDRGNTERSNQRFDRQQNKGKSNGSRSDNSSSASKGNYPRNNRNDNKEKFNNKREPQRNNFGQEKREKFNPVQKEEKREWKQEQPKKKENPKKEVNDFDY